MICLFWLDCLLALVGGMQRGSSLGVRTPRTHRGRWSNRRLQPAGGTVGLPTSTNASILVAPGAVTVLLLALTALLLLGRREVGRPRPGRRGAGDVSTAPDPFAVLRSRGYVTLLIFAAVVGVPVSALAYGFLKFVDVLQTWVFVDLPDAIGDPCGGRSCR